MKISHRTIPFFFFMVFAVLYSLGAFWGMPSEFVPEIDSEFPSGPFNFIAHIHENNAIGSRYPVFHKLLVLPVYASILGVFKVLGFLTHFSPQWPYGFKNPAWAMTVLIYADRVLSIFMAAAITCMLWLIIKLIVKPNSTSQKILASIIIGSFGFSGVFAFYARSTNYDIPALFWWTLSFYFIVKIVFAEHWRKRNLILSGVLGAMAAATKDQMAFFVLCNAAVLFAACLTKKQFRKGISLSAGYSAIFIFSYLVTAVLPQPSQWISHIAMLKQLSLDESKFVMFGNTVTGQLHFLAACLQNYSHVMSFGGTVLLICAGIFAIVQKQWKLLITVVVPIVGTYLFLFAQIRFVYERFMLNYALLGTILIGASMVILLQWFENSKKKWGSFILFTIAISLITAQIGYSFTPVTLAQTLHAKKQLSRSIFGLVPQGDTIQYQGTIVALPDANVYKYHKLALDSNTYDSIPSTRMGHVLVRSNINRKYVLADHDLLSRDENIHLEERWNGKDFVDTTGLAQIALIKCPDFVEQNIHVYSAAQEARTFRVAMRYYLYKREMN